MEKYWDKSVGPEIFTSQVIALELFKKIQYVIHGRI